MVLTNNEELYKKLCLYRSHGITRDVSLMTHEADGPWYYQQVDLGYNYIYKNVRVCLFIASPYDKLLLSCRLHVGLVSSLSVDVENNISDMRGFGAGPDAGCLYCCFVRGSLCAIVNYLVECSIAGQHIVMQRRASCNVEYPTSVCGCRPM